MPGARTYRTTAIVLGRTKLKETDLILTLITQDGRQVRAVAKGARKPGSRLAARCELACCCDMLLAHGRTLDIVSQAELLEAPLGASPDYDLLCAASAVCEVARLCCYEDAVDPFVFAITRALLSKLGAAPVDGPHLDLLVAAYVFKVLSHIGYRPDLSSCVACGDPALSCFSASMGGLLCSSCSRDVAGAEPVDSACVTLLRACLGRRFEELAAIKVDGSSAAFALGLSHIWAATHLDARMRAFEFLLGR